VLTMRRRRAGAPLLPLRWRMREHMAAGCDGFYRQRSRALGWGLSPRPSKKALILICSHRGSPAQSRHLETAMPTTTTGGVRRGPKPPSSPCRASLDRCRAVPFPSKMAPNRPTAHASCAKGVRTDRRDADQTASTTLRNGPRRCFAVAYQDLSAIARDPTVRRVDRTEVKQPVNALGGRNPSDNEANRVPKRWPRARAK
jgi:hypothetical protein